ncbi:MAG: hypothetical protein ACQEXX_01280 [Bacillota bacterium]
MTKTAKEVVEFIKSKKDLKSEKDFIYYLTHTYDEEQRKVWVKAPYDLETFEVICAFIQYECSEIEQSFSMDQTDVLKVLEQFYDSSGTFSTDKQAKKKAIEIDLYENWEIYCGLADEIQNIELLKREGLNELLNEFVESFYQVKPEWRPKEEVQ